MLYVQKIAQNKTNRTENTQLIFMRNKFVFYWCVRYPASLVSCNTAS